MINLIHFQGLKNCYLACIINLAALLDVNYQNAFSTLWSEIDLTYCQKYHIYMSKHLFTNLESLGGRAELLACVSPEEADESLSLLSDGELFYIGMDALYIPWCPVYHNFAGPHYFFAQKEDADTLLCFDPTYDEVYTQIKFSDILSHAFELGHICRVDEKPFQIGVEQEAYQILRCHPKTQEELHLEIMKCSSQEYKNITSLAKKIDAMIDNRHLFRHYLYQSLPDTKDHHRFFNKDFFSRWDAVKNGLYKASILRDNQSVLDQVSELFNNLIKEEISIAEQILSKV